MTLKTSTAILAASVTLLAALPASAVGNATITQKGNSTCITGNGLPTHSTGTFPNSGNPHSISAQNVNVCVPANPQKNGRATWIDRGAIGIGLNGVAFRPEAADYWSASGRRNMTRQNTGWRFEPMGNVNLFGVDMNNAHVDQRGLYHYHGKPTGLLKEISGTQVGYAADGFEIHYLGGRAKSGYALKSGTRPSGPGGRYDGTFVEDYEYVGGAGALDQCNGAMLNNEYVYFVTDTFPFYPRCLWGNAVAIR